MLQISKNINTFIITCAILHNTMRICIQYHGHIIALLAIVQAAITKYGQVLITAGVERRNSSILTHMSYSAGPSLQIDVLLNAATQWIQNQFVFQFKQRELFYNFKMLNNLPKKFYH